MRAKKAKNLRRVLKKLFATLGLEYPKKEYIKKEVVGYIPGWVYDKEKEDMVYKKKLPIKREQVLLEPNCARKMYKNKKRGKM